mmetsp:Transcript_1939/g.4404  ORF Transcript_1939/g.4404 Transcript_1939/m.4404 type:complete len:351 (-) Transcript_1939:594-1646(-)
MPVGPMGFPPRWEPNTSSRTLLRGKRKAKAWAPVRPMLFRSNSKRSSSSHLGSASAISVAPRSPIRFALNWSSRRLAPAPPSSNKRATEAAPSSPRSHSIILATSKRPAQACTKPQAAAQPRSPTFCRLRVRSWQPSRNWLKLSTTVLGDEPGGTSAGSRVMASTSECPASAKASATSRTARQVLLLGSNSGAMGAKELAFPLLAAFLASKPLGPASNLHLPRRANKSAKAKRVRSPARRQSVSKLSDTAGWRSRRPPRSASCGPFSSFPAAKAKRRLNETFFSPPLPTPSDSVSATMVCWISSTESGPALAKSQSAEPAVPRRPRSVTPAVGSTCTRRRLKQKARRRLP